jgi:hypothetical protein
MGTSVSDSFRVTGRPVVLEYEVNVCLTCSLSVVVLTLVQALDFVND